MLAKRFEQKGSKQFGWMIVICLFTFLACGPGASSPEPVYQSSDIITLFEASTQQIHEGESLSLSWSAKSLLPHAPLTCFLLSQTDLLESEQEVACEASLELSLSQDTNFQLLAIQGLERYLSNVIPVTVTAAQQNQAPFVTGDEYQVAVGGKLVVSAAEGVLANDRDVNGDPMSVKLVQDSLYGELNLAADGSFSYQHDASTHLRDFFTYIATDGKADSSTVTVILTIDPVKKLEPKADRYELLSGTTLRVDRARGVLANDDLADDARAELLRSVEHGVLSLNDDGSFSYTHDASPSDSDSFSYRALSSGQSSEPIEVTLSITPVPGILSIPIRSGADDTEEYDLSSRSPGLMFPDSPDLDMGSDSAGDKLVGLRFTDIPLAAGTKIKLAYVQFQADDRDGSSGSPRIAVYLIDEANAAPFSTADKSLSSRRQRFISVWEPKSWSKQRERGERQQLDVTRLVETALSKSDWRSGNAIAMVLDNYRGGLRAAESFEGNPQGAATLIIHTE